jgi:diketogulonate reductase-like aldo/keto reductase
MPLVGFGTYCLSPGDECFSATLAALQTGYRLVDTAAMYRNEHSVAAALHASRLARKDVWITSKLLPSQHGYENTLKAFAGSCRELQTTYLDLYLVHWPGVQSKNTSGSPREVRQGTWRALQELYAAGKCKAIGVSNYQVEHLEEITSGELPHVNQIEFHPLLQHRPLLAYCRKKQIFFQAYSSLGQGKETLIENPTILAVAQRKGRTPAQVLLRWALEQGIGVLPRSRSPARIAENFALFDFTLDDTDMAEITQLGKRKEVHFSWDSAGVP